MPIHGFGMNLNFQEIGKYIYKATSNGDTLSQYPFEFDLYVSYTINKNKLITLRKNLLLNLKSKKIILR